LQIEEHGQQLGAVVGENEQQEEEAQSSRGERKRKMIARKKQELENRFLRAQTLQTRHFTASDFRMVEMGMQSGRQKMNRMRSYSKIFGFENENRNS
jgi:hypothetical protein